MSAVAVVVVVLRRCVSAVAVNLSHHCVYSVRRMLDSESIYIHTYMHAYVELMFVKCLQRRSIIHTDSFTCVCMYTHRCVYIYTYYIHE
jgi:hypothetical protein